MLEASRFSLIIYWYYFNHHSVRKAISFSFINLQPVKKLRLSFLIVFILAACSAVKEVPLSDGQLKTDLKKHITTLASDQFMGRETGTKGEELAYEYIISQFKSIGLQPKGDKKYIQEFTFTEGANIGKSTQLYINANSYKLNQDYYPLQFSGNGIITGYIVRVGYGIFAPLQGRNDYINKINLSKKIFVIESTYPDGNNPHGKYADFDLRWRVDNAISRGAAAVIFINSDSTEENPKADFTHKFTSAGIPVIFAKGDAGKLLKDGVITNCTVGVEIQPLQKNRA